MRNIGIFQILMTLMKLIPLLLIILFAWPHFHLDYLWVDFNVSGDSHFTALSSAAAMTLWAFIGLESAAVVAGAVENPRRNIPLATIIGTLIAATVYISSSVALMGLVPADVLQYSTSPFADGARLIFGQWGGALVAIGAILSCIGSLNGWICVQGQIIMPIADDGLFPKIFAWRNKAGLPAWGIVFTSGLATILIILTSVPNLTEQFGFIILMAALTSLLPYLYTCAARIILLKRENGKMQWFNKQVIIAILAGLYAFWMITAGLSYKIVFYGIIVILLSIVVYVWCKWRALRDR